VPLQIGNRGGSIPSWDGLMDEVYLFDHALSDEEIAALVPEDTVVEGDYNGNGTVDAADYTMWRDGLGGQFSVEDYQVWKSNFGQAAEGNSAGLGGAAVPEPSTV